VEGANLVIKGKREATKEEKEKEGKTIYSERKEEQIYRMVELPVPVLTEKAQAEIKNGVLELKLPKAAKPKSIKVAAA
jgi:HSP20 family protein